MRTLKADEVTFTIHVSQDDIPVRGNALASGDDAADKEAEDEILTRLDAGDVWAWACVEVRATWEEWHASDYLGGCCYADENDFKIGNFGYYEDMRKNALDQLNADLAAIMKKLEPLAREPS
jgi:hypothetical protein